MIYFIIYCAKIWPGPWLEHDIKNQRKATKWCPNNTLFKYHCYTKVGYGFCFGRSVLLSYEPNLRRSRALILKRLKGWAQFKRISWQFRCALPAGGWLWKDRVREKLSFHKFARLWIIIVSLVAFTSEWLRVPIITPDEDGHGLLCPIWITSSTCHPENQ